MKGTGYLLLGFLFIVSSSVYGQLWKQYSDTAKMFQGQRQLSKAIDFYLKSKTELQKDSSDTKTFAMINYSLADVYKDAAKTELAETIYIDSKNLIEKLSGKYHADYAVVCNGLAVFYAFTGQYDKAQQFFSETRDVREKLFGKEHLDYAASCRNLGNVYRVISEYEKAETLFFEARKIIEKSVGRVHRDFAASCSDLAILYAIRADYKRAEPFFLEAREIREKLVGTKHAEYAASCNNLGLFYKRTGQYKKSESFLLEAKQINEDLYGNNHPSYATDCSNLATLYIELGDFEKAESLFLMAKAIREKYFGRQNPDYAASCNSLAIVYDETGQYEKAEQLYLEAKQIREKLGGTTNAEYASSCANLSNFYRNRGDYTKAEPLSLEALEILEKIFSKNHPEYAKSCVNLALVYKATGDYDKTLSYFTEAKNLFADMLGKDHPEYAKSCRDIARLYHILEKYTEAKELYLEALSSMAKSLGKSHYIYGETVYNLAAAYRNVNDRDRAYASYQDAFNILYGEVDKFFLFASESEKQKYIRQIASFDNTMLSFMTASYSPSKQALSYNLSLKNRNLILSSARQMRDIVYNSGDSSIISKYNKWMSKREELAFLLAKPVENRKGQDKEAEEEANELEKSIMKESSAVKNKLDLLHTDWKKIQQTLKTGEAAIEFLEFIYDDGKRWTDSIYYIALVARKDKQEPELIRLFEKEDIDSVLRTTKSIDKEKTINLRYAQNQSLYKLIWQPLEKHLQGVKKIYFAPSGMLHKIPLAALTINETERIGDRYKLVQLSTTASVVNYETESLSTSDKLYLYGGVLYDGDTTALKQATVQYTMKDVASRSLPEDLDRGNIWQYLPDTRLEAETINKMAMEKGIASKLNTGWDATEESVKSLNGKNSPSVLHIATHGFFFADPATKPDKSIAAEGRVFRQSDNPLFRSGLTMAGANFTWNGKPVQGIEDGILTSYEVSNLYLPNTKLAVLSACETGMGDIQGSEGVYGLQRAFKIAGVKNLVMSLWDVPDAATAEFMTEFYKTMFAGKTIEDAFHNTQTVMKNKYRSEPYKWAAWVLIR